MCASLGTIRTYLIDFILMYSQLQFQIRQFEKMFAGGPRAGRCPGLVWGFRGGH